MPAGRRRRGAAIAAGTLAVIAGGGGTALAAPVITPTTDAPTIATAILGDGATLTGAAFTARPTDPAAAGGPAATTATLADTPGGFAGFPLAGPDAGLLTSGSVANIVGDQAAQEDVAWDDDPAAAPRGASVHDATTLRVDVNVAPGRSCLALSYRFLSEEFPEFVGSQYNDAFVAELDRSTWTTDAANELLVPDDFATKAGGKPVSVNGVGPTSVDPGEAAGTVFDAATGLVTTKTPVTPGPHSVYLSIFDQSDHIYDSAVLLDRLAFIDEPPTTCKPPEVAVIVPPPPAPPAPAPPAPAPPRTTSPSRAAASRSSTARRRSRSRCRARARSRPPRRPARPPRGSRAAAARKQKKLVKPARKVATKAGPVKLKLHLTKRGKRVLKHKHKLKVRLAISFTPTGGTKKTELAKLTIKAKKKHKR